MGNIWNMYKKYIRNIQRIYAGMYRTIYGISIHIYDIEESETHTPVSSCIYSLNIPYICPVCFPKISPGCILIYSVNSRDNVGSRYLQLPTQRFCGEQIGHFV